MHIAANGNLRHFFTIGGHSAASHNSLWPLRAASYVDLQEWNHLECVQSFSPKDLKQGLIVGA